MQRSELGLLGYESGSTRLNSRASRSIFAIFALFVLALGVVSPNNAQGQNWRITTPRDTVRLPANVPYWIDGNFPFSSNIQINLKISGTFGIWPGQDSTGFDARYTYNIPGWLAPYPLIDPPTFDGKSYEIYLEVDTNRLSHSIIRVDQATYQQSHVYTGRYTSTGLPMRFHIMNRMDLDSAGAHGYYYATGTGALTVELSQFTAGISLQSDSVDFGTVLIGTSATLLDSMASYGIDPLQVDSIRIVGPSDFSFVSQYGDHFALATETTNLFQLSFVPSQKFDEYGILRVYSHNADGPDRVRNIQLHGIGGVPSIAVGPNTLDFGKVRVKDFVSKPVDVYNGGNANLYVTEDAIAYDPTGAFTRSPQIQSGSVTVVPGYNWQVAVHFQPMQRQRYAGVMYIQGQGLPLDSVMITGQGVAPVPVLSDTALAFGNVRRGDSQTRTVTLTNLGDMTATVVACGIRGPNQSAFQLIPSDNTFLLDPDSSRTFTIIFAPGTGPEGPRAAWLQLNFDDDSVQTVDLLGYEIEPKLVLGRNLIDFGKVRVGNTEIDTVSIRNNGNVTLLLNPPPFVAPLNAPFSTVTPPSSLGPLVHDSVRVAFTPAHHGYAAAWLRTTAGGQFDSVYLIGFGGIPYPTLTRDTIDFGILPANYPSTLFTVLGDSGDYPVKVTQILISGPNASDFTIPSNGVTPSAPFSVPDSGQQTIDIQFVTSLKLGQQHIAYLGITFEDGTHDTVVLLAREQSQYVEFASKTLAFGKVRVKTKSAPLVAVFSNGSSQKLTVHSIYVAQADTVYWPSDTISTVPAEDTAGLPIYFEPLKRGYFTGYLHASSGSIRPDSVLLTGTGAAPVAQFSQRTVACGPIKIGLSTVSPLTLTNIGDWPLITSFAIRNDAYNDFSISLATSTNAIDTVQPGDSLNFAITFKPSVPRLLHTADLVFTYDDSTTDTIKLTGEDIYGKIVLDSSAINFGKVRVNTNAQESVHLVNTSPATLTANSVQLTSALPPFTSSVSGTVTLPSRTSAPIAITFAPKTRGAFAAQLLADGGDMQNDTLPIAGIGVAPVPQFSVALMDFGNLYFGITGVQTATLTNIGDFPLTVTGVSIRGVNYTDFTPEASLPQSFVLQPGDSLVFNIDFAPTTPLQVAARTSDLIFTQDDGTTFFLPLTELDKAPAGMVIGFKDFLVRPGDVFYDDLLLETPIPAAANLRDLSGTFTFDTTVARLLSIERGWVDSSSLWTVTHTVTKLGKVESVSYDVNSGTDTISGSGSLLRLQFEANSTASVGSETSVTHSTILFANNNQIIPQAIAGVIVIDSTCGSTHLESGGEALASFVQQNSPNPFGGMSGTTSTSIPFDVGADNIPVTIRIFDVTGKEVLRPLDGQMLLNGHYTVIVPSSALGSGIFFYEFQAAGGKPEVKKMIVAQ
jgi:hypothetical protein